ncbi:DNA/RNA nuclease SfsA [Serpentinicella sp. ANB-PHB4]|uniref:DNA/RNA nuclease SfsA n=1 Tax=Serpentinicella sp. ANB-PHB4 TaxID=3074076 RepID=UPI00285C9052|nr:DNA/RNA nuclease SfsA [Serpentinicella sp. ANB-PHB4]MDR5659034.1 DNA/RNA nuclease SfsA [Serpentinicella sp. ANB-PHB4]
MKLEYNMVFGKFVKRINRFIAHVQINSKIEVVHVMNTGRLKELLTLDADVMLSYEPSAKRKTAYDLRMVKKDGAWISIDSQLPNKIVEEGLRLNTIKELAGYNDIKRECTYRKSRFDFKISKQDKHCFIEVKGVTLEKNGWGYFPDAPTTRGQKHIEEMIEAVKEGYRGVILFLIQHPHIKGFSPNKEMDPHFSSTLIKAQSEGVELLAYGCKVAIDEISISNKVAIKL